MKARIVIVVIAFLIFLIAQKYLDNKVADNNKPDTTKVYDIGEHTKYLYYWDDGSISNEQEGNWRCSTEKEDIVWEIYEKGKWIVPKVPVMYETISIYADTIIIWDKK